MGHGSYHDVLMNLIVPSYLQLIQKPSRAGEGVVQSTWFGIK